MLNLGLGINQLTEKEPYMSQRQLDYFHEKLLNSRQELSERINLLMAKIREFDDKICESVERSAQEFDRELAINAQNQNWLMLRDIDQAIERIKDGSYGYCEETEEPIGLKRLNVSPVARFCIRAQEAFEKAERYRR